MLKWLLLGVYSLSSADFVFWSELNSCAFKHAQQLLNWAKKALDTIKGTQSCSKNFQYVLKHSFLTYIPTLKIFFSLFSPRKLQNSEKARNSEAKIRVTRTTTQTENHVTQHETGPNSASIVDQNSRQSWTKNGVNRGPNIVSIGELNQQQSSQHLLKLGQNNTSLQFKTKILIDVIFRSRAVIRVTFSKKLEANKKQKRDQITQLK